MDLINSGAIDMVLNTPGTREARRDGYAIRAATTAADKPIITTVKEFAAAVQAMAASGREPLGVKSLQEWTEGR